MTSDADLLARYFDFNATAPLRPEAAAALSEAAELAGNPSSVHGFGRSAWRRLQQARSQVAALLGVDPGQITFTSGATEANNLAIAGSGRRRRLISAIEHDCVRAAAGSEAEMIPVTAEGVVDLAALEARLDAGDPADTLVAVMAANNETGVVQPVDAVIQLAWRYGAAVLIDAAQAAGRIPLPARLPSADYITLSAHKFGGPKGVGVLAKAPDVPLSAQIVGGGQESYRRAGTENLPGIVATGAAAQAAANGLTDFARLAELRDRLIAGVRAHCPEAPVYGESAPRLPNTALIGMPGVSAETQLMHFDLAGFAVSTGAACSSGKVQQSHVLTAMGASDAAAGQAVRVSLGWTTTAEAVEAFATAWGKLFARTRERAA